MVKYFPNLLGISTISVHCFYSLLITFYRVASHDTIINIRFIHNRFSVDTEDNTVAKITFLIQVHYQLFHLIVVGEAYHCDRRDKAELITAKQSPVARPECIYSPVPKKQSKAVK